MAITLLIVLILPILFILFFLLLAVLLTDILFGMLPHNRPPLCLHILFCRNSCGQWRNRHSRRRSNRSYGHDEGRGGGCSDDRRRQHWQLTPASPSGTHQLPMPNLCLVAELYINGANH